MKNLTHVDSMDSLKQAVGHNQHYWLFKHSSTCPVSANAWDEYNEYASLHSNQIFLYLVVQEDPDFSKAIEEITGVKHESPQLFHFTSQTVDWHASHDDIKSKSMKEFIF